VTAFVSKAPRDARITGVDHNPYSNTMLRMLKAIKMRTTMGSCMSAATRKGTMKTSTWIDKTHSWPTTIQRVLRIIVKGNVEEIKSRIITTAQPIFHFCGTAALENIP
jgi:hypothetical protein